MKGTLTALAVLLLAAGRPASVIAQSDKKDAASSGVVIIGPQNEDAETDTPGAPVPEPLPVREPTPLPRREVLRQQSPIGSVVAWLKSLPGTPGLPPNWVECNGQVLEMQDSPYHGQALPNLNGANDAPRRFLRGSPESGTEGGKATHDHGPFLVQRTGDRRVNVGARRPVSHLPPYYEVTWIMRVR